MLLAPIDQAGDEEDPIYKYVRGLDRDSDDIEAGRLFYVAATRAKRQLHLMACGKPGEDGAVKAPTRRTLLEKIWWQAQERFGPAPADAGGKDERTPIVDVLRRLPADFAAPAAPQAVSWAGAGEARAEPDIEFSWVGETARHVGTVVHRWLQRIAEDELRGWDANKVAGLRNRFAAELARRGVSPDELKASTERVVNALTNAVTDERGRWVLGPHPEARSEYRIRSFAKDRFKTYVMDRVFKDEGALWIVDHKTSGHEGADVEAFLDRERSRYAAQLDAYAAVLQGSRLGLYFPLLKGWRQWNR